MLPDTLVDLMQAGVSADAATAIDVPARYEGCATLA